MPTKSTVSPAQTLINRHRAISYPYHCRFGEADLEIYDGVFCPTLTKVSPFLLSTIDFRTNEHVLDAFQEVVLLA